VADHETMTFITQTYQRADAFLFDRRTSCRTTVRWPGCWR
jgi:hypothetical protein